MVAIIVSVICRLIAYVSVLAFVFGLVAMSGNYGYLWFLLLIGTCKVIPTYGYTRRVDGEENGGNDGE